MTSVLSIPATWPLPTYRHRPLGRVTSSGPTYIRLGELAGLYLDDQQSEFIDEALAEDRDGFPVATQVGLIEPRQNGKDSIAEVLELGDLFLSDIPVSIHSTHRYTTTMEHYLRVSGLIKDCPDLDAQVANYYTANGNCAISLKNGCRLKFLARAAGNARGFAAVRRLILNEAFKLGWDLMGAMGPTALTRRDRQIWLLSSPPRATSDVLHDLRRRTIEGGEEAKRLMCWVYENEPGVDPRDMAAIARVNPAYPHRITKEAFEDALVEMGADEFVIECMGVPEMPDGLSNVIGEKLWEGCKNPADFVPWVFTADVAYDRQTASIASAGPDSEGRYQVEVIPARFDGSDPPPGVEWVVPRLLELVERHKPRRVYIDAKVSGSMLDDLLKAGMVLHVDLLAKLKANEITQKTFDKTPSLVTITTQDVARAAGAFYDAVLARSVAHRGQDSLDTAVNGAKSRPLADAWAWDRRKSEGDVTPLIAVTLAHFACVQMGDRPKPKARVVNLAEAMAKLENESTETEG